MPRRFNGSIPRPQSRRFRVSVPDADESVLEWIGAQSDLSASVRALIRDAIERQAATASGTPAETSRASRSGRAVGAVCDY